MAAPQRRVRHLRVAAGSEDAVRAAMPRFEDALRCASLPDTGARLLLVRRLALGRVARQASSQAIAQLIEARFADSAVVWTQGEGADARQAERVMFPSAWHARVALSGRLLRGRGASAWYWALAVPEFRRDVAAGDNVRAIARAVALSPEARVALPAWAAHVARASGVRALAAVVPERLGEALVREAKVPWDASEATGSGRADESMQVAPTTPEWLRCLLHAGGWRGEPASAPASRHARTPRPPVQGSDRVTTVPARDEPAVGVSGETFAGRDVLPGKPASSHAPIASPSAHTPVPASRTFERADATESSALDAHAELDAAATSFGGLLFLLPVLSRLGLPHWVETADADPAAWVRAVLAAALDRLRAPQDDPMRALVAPIAPLARIDAPAPASWQNDILLAPCSAPAVALSTALTDAPGADAQAAVWLVAVRRWLRRGARTGLASVVCRPGLLSLTPTHVDVYFSLGLVDLRMRRLGLDIDPGWLPWFGRVVAYHYRDEPESAP